MSKQFSQFPGGNPPADTDRFLIGRVDGASPSGFSNYIMTWAQIKAAIGGSSSSSGAGVVLSLEEAIQEEPLIIVPSFISDLSTNFLRAFQVYIGNNIGTLGVEIFSDGTMRFGASRGIALQSSGRSVFRNLADGLFKISNWTENGFDRLQFGGLTNLFPALAISGPLLRAVTADLSSLTDLEVNNIFARNVPGMMMPEDVVIDEPTPIPGPVGAQGVKGADGTTTFATTVFFLPPDDPDEVFPIPGRQGADGIVGSDGRNGLSIYLEPELPEEPIQIPGTPGRDGINGTIGRDGLTVFLEPEQPEEPLLIPGPAGAVGATGAGTAGRDGVTIFLEPSEPEDPQVIPGPTGPQGPAGGGGGSLSLVEADLGATPVSRGSFTLTDASITPASKIAIWQAPGPYTGKGTRADEAEMDQIVATAEAGTGQATVRWRVLGSIGLQPKNGQGATNAIGGVGRPQIGVTGIQGILGSVLSMFSPIWIGRVKGNFKFHYMVAT